MNIGIFSHLLRTKSITEDKIQDFIADSAVKRICFSRIQKHTLWKTNEGEDVITVPFADSIGTILKEQTGIALRKSSKGKYYSKLSAEEYRKASMFIKSHADVVFLRDLLDVSVALSLNFEDDCKTHTPIGRLEKNAKYDNSDKDLENLADIVDDFIGNNPPYKDADLICAVPPTNMGEDNLPMKVIGKLKQFIGNDISNCVEWTSKTESLKNADGADKMEILKQSGFKVADGTNLKNKNVVLIDDLYMSGSTLQYVAMKLKEAGAGKVYGLCFVKSLSNR